MAGFNIRESTGDETLTLADESRDSAASLLDDGIFGNADSQLAFVALRKSRVDCSLELWMCVAIVRCRDVQIGQRIVVNEFCWFRGDGHRVNSCRW